MKFEELSKTYNPAGIEERWYSTWENAGYFRADADRSEEPFTIVIPPPNVTGVLHMGHALDNTLQDILVRYKRMDGFATLWVPGTDHAGIATQNVVEKALAKENLTRQELGREKFLERVWAWKEQSGNHITRQLRRLGASCDWSRERFTMDPGLSKAVRHVFVKLYQEGLIYRSSYLISWCPRCHTALSDLEVEHKEIDGQLTYFRYETTDGRNITVATTRPETMLGDSAVAVHGKDERFTSLVGATIKHPFVEREFPIVADDTVKKEFGTGAVKITPAHDPNDYDLGKRKNLAFISVIDGEGKITAEGGPYQGLDRLVARKKIVADLKSRGLFEKVEPHRHAVGHCQRCGTIVEPRISEQWFVKIAPLAKPAIQAVTQSKTTFVPENWTKVYLDWMENIRDWCISRQLWWGHRIPVWYCQDCSATIVTIDDPTACSSCKSTRLNQDPDVLDTWFSSALWPFSTLGWPEETKDLKKFYPTSVLVTGFDIIFFWVARMMMMGLKFMNDVPFRVVHIHALVRDASGQKMSKSRGNVVDPLEIMDKYGTDAFRFALTSFAAQGRDILLSEQRIEGYRNFINKVWNASRFALTTLGDDEEIDPHAKPSTLPDQWIRERTELLTTEVRRALDEMRFNEAADALYQFTWHEFCDWYLESIKSHFGAEATNEARNSSRSTLVWTLDRLLRLLHPMTPFVTEEIWQRLPMKRALETITLAPYPKDKGFRAPQASAAFSIIQSVVDTIRNIRSENKISPAKKIPAQIHGASKDSSHSLSIVRTYATYIQTLAGLSELSIEAKEKTKTAALGIAGDLEIRVPLEGLVDLSAERERLIKEREKATNDVSFLERRLSDVSYRSKAPAQLIAKDEAKLNEAKQQIEKLSHSLDLLKS